MAMTPEEMVAVFGQQAELFANSLTRAKERSSYSGVAQNVRQVFKCCLMQGLIQWRHGLGEPVAALTQAADVVRQGPGMLKSMEPTTPPEGYLPVTSSLFVNYLLNRQMLQFDEDRLVSATYQGSPQMIAVLKAELQAEGFLGRALWGCWDQAKWDGAVLVLQQNKRASLVCETYAMYERLLKTPANEAAPLVREAEILFRKRAKNGYFSGAQTEGGGPDNEHTVDYRLAAILKKIGYTGETMHRWRWG